MITFDPAIPTTAIMPPTIGCIPSDHSDCTTESTADAMAHLTKVYIAGLLILGFFGNVYCVTAFLMPIFRRVPSTLYLAALALSDIGFLMTLGLMWMRSIGLRFLDMPHVCTMCMFMSYFCCFVSSWLVFAITMERYLLASGDRRNGCCPIVCSKTPTSGTRKTPTSRKHKRVRLTFATILVFGILINSWVLFAADSVVMTDQDEMTNSTVLGITPAPGLAVCDVNHNAAGQYYVLFNALDMIFSFTLPFLGVLILNMKIGFRVYKAQTLARQQQHGDSRTITSGTGGDDLNAANRETKSSDSHAETGAGLDRLLNDPDLIRMNERRKSSTNRVVPGRSRRTRREKIERRVTQLLVTVSMAYLILNLPSYVHRIVFAFETNKEDEKTTVLKTPFEVIAETISYLMFYTQFSINFFLYSCHGCMFGIHC